MSCPATAAEAPPTPGGVTGHQLRALTGARFFAAMFVVVYHFCRPVFHTLPGPVHKVLASGYVSVGFFFVLSGFILSYGYLTPGGALRGTKKDFWIARFARIYPAYLLAFCLAMPFNVIGSVHANQLPTAIAKLTVGGLAVLSLLQAWTPWSAWYWNYPAWSLSAEAFFYLMFPLLAVALGRRTKRECALLLPVFWVCALLGPAVFSATHGVMAEPPFSHAQLAVEFTPAMRLPEFAIGVLLGRLFVLGGVSGTARQWMVWAGMAAALAVMAFGNLPRVVLSNGALLPAFAMMILGLTQDKGVLARFLGLPLMVLLGEASYAIYILQLPLSYLMGVDSGTNTVFQPWPTVIFFLVLIAASVLCFRYVEQPMRRRIRAGLSARRAAAYSDCAPVSYAGGRS